MFTSGGGGEVGMAQKLKKKKERKKERKEVGMGYKEAI